MSNLSFVVTNLTSKSQDHNLLIDRINLQAKKGEIIVIMGPNGAGKSSFFKTLCKHHNIQVKSGQWKINHQPCAKLSTNQIAKMGVFFIPQHSINLDGVNTLSFLRVLNEQRQKPLTFEKLYDLIAKNMQILKLPTELLKRDLNVEFSGGQKKKMELLQSLIVEPKIYLIDEIDSGLDIEAIKVISNFIKQKKKDSIFFIISHNNEFIKSIKPNKIAVMHNKKIIKIASPSIVNQIERSGYQTFCPNNEDIKKRLLNKCLMKK